MDWALFATILKVAICLVALGVMAWLFSVADYYWAIVGSLAVTYGTFWLTYLLVWHIHCVATRLGVVW